MFVLLKIETGPDRLKAVKESDIMVYLDKQIGEERGISLIVEQKAMMKSIQILSVSSSDRSGIVFADVGFLEASLNAVRRSRSHWRM